MNHLNWLTGVALPDAWSTLPLRRVGTILNGGTPSADEANWGGHIPFVTPPDLNGADGSVIDVTQRSLTAVGAASSGLAPTGSVLVSTRAPIGHIGRVARDSSFNQGCRAVVPGVNAEARFLAYALVGARTEMIARGQGTTFVELSGVNFSSLPMPVPRLREQQEIADYLDRETHQINTLIAAQERFVGLLQERRRAVVERSLTEALPVRFGTRLKHLVRSVRQGWSPQCFPWPADGIETWAVLKTGAANRGIFRPYENKALPDDLEPRPWTVVRQGDLVVARANTRDLVGSAAVVTGHYPKLMLSDKLYALGLDEAKALPQYVAHLMASRKVRDLIEMDATGASSSMLNISREDILNLPMAVPSVAEQRHLLDQLDQMTTKIDELINKTQRHIELAKERMSALITAAVTGQIEIKET